MADTILCIVVYAFLAVKGYYEHIVAAATLAPLLLLRTKNSLLWAADHRDDLLRPFLISMDFVARNWKEPPLSKSGRLLYGFVMLIITIPVFVFLLGFSLMLALAFVCAPVAAKAAAVARSMWIEPRELWRSIPHNWVRLVACTDLFQRPEPFPGYLASSDPRDPVLAGIDLRDPVATIRKLLKSPQTPDSEGPSIIIGLLWLVAFTSIMYRFTIKGSSIIYLPFLLMVHLTNPSHVRERLTQIRTLAIYRLIRLVSLILLIAISSKVVLAPAWRTVAPILESYGDPRFVHIFVAPLEIPRWQIASGLNAVLSWGVFLLADWALQKPTIGTPLSLVFRTAWVLSLPLSLYTTSILVYNAFSLRWSMPSIGERWFPW